MPRIWTWIVVILVSLAAWELAGGYLGYTTLGDVYGEFTKDTGEVRIDRVYLVPQGRSIADDGRVWVNSTDTVNQIVAIEVFIDAPQTLTSTKWSWVLLEGNSLFPPDPFTAPLIASGEIGFTEMFQKGHLYRWFWEYDSGFGGTILTGFTLILYNTNFVEVARDYHDIKLDNNI